MKIKTKKFEIQIDLIILIIFLISLFSKKAYSFFEKYFICFLFIAFHESMHMLIASIFGKYPYRLNINVAGLNLEYIVNNTDEKLKNVKWILIFLSGPIANAIFAIIFWRFEFVRNINLIMTIINLMPIYPLDGYNILKHLLFFNKKMDINKIIDIISKLLLTSLFIFGIFIFMETKNVSIIVFTVSLILITTIQKKSTNIYK